MSTTQCKCYAAKAASAPLEPFTIERRAPTSTDVVIAIKFAG
jgi:D-arabinose 1-dehydrogenase-like Zn-dependent alcohol dehydrogenase